MSEREEYSLPKAAAALLNTPRALRHALGRTHIAWQSLHGEINWNHLFAVNVLRSAAPECFIFLLRRWDRLHSVPSRVAGVGDEGIMRIRAAIIADWSNVTAEVEWNAAAALSILTFLLPAADWWLVEPRNWYASADTRQGIDVERYWLRAVSETYDPADVLDQQVYRHFQQWVQMPTPDALVVQQICSSAKYNAVWGYFADSLLADQYDRRFLLTEHILKEIARKHGAAATYESEGFYAGWDLCKRIERREENKTWLIARLTEASQSSISLVNSIWHFYGISGGGSVLRNEDRNEVRATVVKVLRNDIQASEQLESLIDPNRFWPLNQLIYDPGNESPTETGPQSWSWLTPILLEGLRRKSTKIAIEVARLLKSSQQNTVDSAILSGFFLGNEIEVAQLLKEIAGSVADQESQNLVSAIADSTARAIASRPRQLD